ncbi:MAG: hypothetical protein AAFV29_06580 [Myxococcota bacterium]
MNDVAQDTPTIVETEVEHEEAGAKATYIQRTRDVLSTQWKEASKVRADTHSALMEVWRDLQTDLRDQYASIEENAKRQTRTLWNKLPFTGAQAEAEKAETEVEASPEQQVS